MFGRYGEVQAAVPDAIAHQVHRLHQVLLERRARSARVAMEGQQSFGHCA